MNTGRKSSNFKTSDHTAELGSDNQEIIKAMLEETMEKIRQMVRIQWFYRGQGNGNGQKRPLLSPLSAFGFPRLTNH